MCVRFVFFFSQVIYSGNKKACEVKKQSYINCC
jgi:hypothetical protein